MGTSIGASQFVRLLSAACSEQCLFLVDPRPDSTGDLQLAMQLQQQEEEEHQRHIAQQGQQQQQPQPPPQQAPDQAAGVGPTGQYPRRGSRHRHGPSRGHPHR